MLASYLLLSFAALASATTQDSFFAALLKRQEPGTPAYACHEACGTAVTLSKGAEPCENAEFTARYNACLQCAGPDDVNIWRYYGGSLGKAGAACGLDTQPQAGASATQVGGSQSVSSSAVVMSSGTATPLPGSSAVASATLAPSSGPITDALTSASSTSGVVVPATSSATVSAPAEVSTNAAATRLGGIDSGSGIFGAMFVAALFGM